MDASLQLLSMHEIGYLDQIFLSAPFDLYPLHINKRSKGPDAKGCLIAFETFPGKYDHDIRRIALYRLDMALELMHDMLTEILTYAVNSIYRSEYKPGDKHSFRLPRLLERLV